MHVRQIRAWIFRFGGLFGQEARERELAEELQSHLEMHIEDNLRVGMTPTEARRQAHLKLGGVQPTKEEYRRQRGIPMIETLMKDLRYALRMLIKSPAFTIVAVLSLALGIGANTTIFSIVNSLLLRPLPVQKPSELVSLANSSGEQRMFPTFSYPNYKDFRDRNNVFSGLLAYRFAPISLSHDGINEKLWGYLVTGNYFEVLGIQPALGRLILPEDDRLAGGHPVTVLSYQGWRQRFGADPNVTGRSVIVNGTSYTIIGVAPEGFFGTEIIAAPELFFPMAMQAQIEVGNKWLEERDSEYLFLQGRMKEGVRIAQAQTALNSIAAQLAREYPDINEGKKVAVTPPGLQGLMKGAVVGFTGVLMGVVGFVLLLACLNLANLLLARAIDRRKEISVRLALGASRMRIVRQLLAESMLLSVASGIAGCLLAYWLLRLAQLIKPPTEFPLLIDLHMDYRVFIFTALVSVITGVLFGLLPALQATKVDVLPALKDEASLGGYRRAWLKNGLIVMQLALALVLLVGGGLMLRALERAQTLDLGFNPQAAVEVSFDLRLQGYDEARGREFQRLLLERARNIPGVQNAGMVDLAPIDLHFSRGAIYIEGQTVERNVKAPRAMTNRVSPGYLRAMGVRLVKGRDFTEQDTANSPIVAIVNETFAKRFWPGQDAIGKRFSRGAVDAPRMQVIGIVQDGRYSSLSEDPQPYFCTSMLQNYSGTTTMIVRSDRDSQKMIASLRAELLRMDPQMPLSSAKPLAARMALPLLPARISATLLGSFGMLALALVAIGIYGIMSYAVSRRTHEIGIRVALGAQPSHLLKLTIAQGMALALAGVLIGLPAALLLARFARRMLYGVSTMDPITYAAVTVILVAVALLACYIPARRATHIDPMTALRNE